MLSMFFLYNISIGILILERFGQMSVESLLKSNTYVHTCMLLLKISICGNIAHRQSEMKFIIEVHTHWLKIHGIVMSTLELFILRESFIHTKHAMF